MNNCRVDKHGFDNVAAGADFIQYTMKVLKHCV